jgi:hypothetical protein
MVNFQHLEAREVEVIGPGDREVRLARSRCDPGRAAEDDDDRLVHADDVAAMDTDKVWWIQGTAG